MRYARPKPSIVLAAVAAVVVSAPFIAGVTDRGDRPPLGLADHSAPDHSAPDRSGTPAPTEIVQVPLKELPAAVLDVVGSGLAAAGITLPPIDPNLFPLPDATLPLPQALAPTPPSAPQKSPTAPKRSPAPGSEKSATATPRMADGRAVGAAVTTIMRDAPIKMLAFTWDRPVDVDMMVRARTPAGAWGPWTALEPANDAAAATAARPAGTEPIWVGDAREVQVAATDDGVAIPAAETQDGGLAQLAVGSAGEVVTKLVTTALATVKATLISPESLLSLGSSLLTPLLGGPSVLARAQWGADESIRCSQPTYSPSVRGAIVHHTAGNNDYTAAQSVEIVRGIYAYHARTLNWCDIGYNVLVDKYGQIFEGAFGGLDRNVEGTHTGGFNRSTVGLSLMGNLDQAPPTAAMITAASRFLRWRLGKAGLNAGGTAHLTAEAFSDSKFPAGAQTNLPMISGHRDYNNTSCPGVHGYSALTQIRSLSGAAPPPAPEDAPTSPPPAPEAPR